MYTSKMMIVMRRDLKMRKGKIAAQAGAITLPEDLPETPLTAWFTRGEAKICVYVDSEEELLALDREAKERGILSALICDAGMTEFHGEPTFTCLALEPLPAERADELTGNLPLY